MDNDLYPPDEPDIGLPWPLRKAWGDSFTYTIGLRDGTVLEIEDLTAEVVGGETWITLRGSGVDESAPLVHQYGSLLPKRAGPWCRGLCVRLSEVVWCADAPRGS
jgi:hypothetical protein